MPRLDLFRRVSWVKSVSLDEDVVAYSPEEDTLARKPRSSGDLFDLHASEDDALTLEDPAVGDVVVLTQHDWVTHLVEVTGASVVPRPRATIRRGTRDARFDAQREVKLLVLRRFDEAPLIEEAFGFDPGAKGGEVLRIDELPAFTKAKTPLWLVQRRIIHKMYDPPKLTIATPPKPAPVKPPPWQRG